MNQRRPNRRPSGHRAPLVHGTDPRNARRNAADPDESRLTPPPSIDTTARASLKAKAPPSRGSVAGSTGPESSINPGRVAGGGRAMKDGYVVICAASGYLFFILLNVLGEID